MTVPIKCSFSMMANPNFNPTRVLMSSQNSTEKSDHTIF